MISGLQLLLNFVVNRLGNQINILQVSMRQFSVWTHDSCMSTVDTHISAFFHCYMLFQGRDIHSSTGDKPAGMSDISTEKMRRVFREQESWEKDRDPPEFISFNFRDPKNGLSCFSGNKYFLTPTSPVSFYGRFPDYLGFCLGSLSRPVARLSIPSWTISWQ